MFEKLTELTDSFLEMGIPGNDCIVKFHGKTVYRHMAGYSDREKKIPMQGNERFYLYSCSKLATCTAALQLWEAGKFQLDDPLFHYMPEFEHMNVVTENGVVPAKNKITIRNLFMMTAGFDYNLCSPSLKKAYEETNGRCPTREAIRYLAQEPLWFEPGEGWQYSLCHDVLAALVEVISGLRFEAYVKSHIFEPMGMTRSDFLIPEAEMEQVAPLYARPNGSTGFDVNPTECKNVYRLGTEYASGGAGCVSTVEDYSSFLEGLRSGILLQKKTIGMMAVDGLTDAQRPAYWPGPAYGYGLGVRCPSALGSTKTDFGWGGAAGAWLAVDPVLDYTVFYVQHVLNSPNQQYRNQIADVISEE